MSEKRGYPVEPPPNEPPPSYSAASSTTTGYPSQQYGVQPGQFGGQQYAGQQYGMQQGQNVGQQGPYGGQMGQFGHQQYAGQQFGMQQQLNTVVVTQPSAYPAVQGYVPDNMNLAIFVTICCFWPLGIVAIMKASEARAALNRGDMQNAMANSIQAKRYSLWAIACGVISLVLAISILIGVFVSINNTCYTCY